MRDVGSVFGINTYSYTQAMTAENCLQHLADQGFKAFELMAYPGHLWIDDDAGTLTRIRQIIEDNNLTLTSLNSPNIDLNIAAAAQEMRAHSLKLDSAFIRMAGELGAEGLILVPGKANPLFPLPMAELEGRFFKALDQLLPIADQCNVALWIENAPFSFAPGAPAIMDMLARYGADQIRVCYDVTNGYYIGEDPLEGLVRTRPRLELVHLSDTTQRVYRHDAVGMGDMPFETLPKAIAAACPQRLPVLEIISPRADADITQSAKALMEMGY